MSSNGIRALDQAMSDAEEALATLPDVLAASRETVSAARSQRARLSTIRAAVEGRLEAAPVLRDQAADRARLEAAYKMQRRALRARIHWLTLLRVWRAVRGYLLGVLVLGLMVAFLYLAYTHRQWLLDVVSGGLSRGGDGQLPALDADPDPDQNPDGALNQSPAPAAPPASPVQP